jgi:hypothetical protein
MKQIDTSKNFEHQLEFWYYVHLNHSSPYLSGEIYDNGSRYSPICLIPYMWELQRDDESLRAYTEHELKVNQLAIYFNAKFLKETEEGNERMRKFLNTQYPITPNWCFPNES